MTKVDPLFIADILLDEAEEAHAAQLIAIAMAESGLRSDARNVNTDGSIDRGLWQINDHWFPGTTDVEADDPKDSTLWASKRGFTTWNAYKNGAYKTHLKLGWTAVRAALLRARLREAEDELDRIQDKIDEVVVTFQRVINMMGDALEEGEASFYYLTKDDPNVSV